MTGLMKNVEAQLSGVDPAGLQLDSCTSALWLPIVPCECSFSSIAWGCCKGSALGGKARSTRELNSLEGDWRHSCLRLGSFFTFQSPSGGLRQHLPCAKTAWGMYLLTLCPVPSLLLLFFWEHFLTKSLAHESSSEKLTFPTPTSETSDRTFSSPWV